jgi:inhibitor of KinA sporulation pathway (predicted exonuclease)
MAVIFDLEFTAWEGSLQRHWLAPGEFAEIIQIGAVRIDPESLSIVAEFDLLVRPRINPRLSRYIQELTGITDEALAERGVDFREAAEAFLSFVAGDLTLAFGADNLMFAENARLHGIGLPPLPRFENLRPWFNANGIATKGLHSCDVGPLLGTPFEGHKHNALHDSRSLAAGVRTLIARGASNILRA